MECKPAYPVLGVGVGGVEKVAAGVLAQQRNWIVDLDREEEKLYKSQKSISTKCIEM